MSNIITGGFTFQGPQSLPVPASIVVDAQNGLHTVPGPNPGETIVELGGSLIDHTIVQANNFLLSWQMNGLRQMVFFPPEAPQMNGMRFDNAGTAFFMGERNAQLQVADAVNNTRFIFDPNSGNIALSDGNPSIASATFINCLIIGAKTIGMNMGANQNTSFLGLQVRNFHGGNTALAGINLSNDLTQQFQMLMTSSTFTGSVSSGIIRLTGTAGIMYFHHANAAGAMVWSLGVALANEIMRLTTTALTLTMGGVTYTVAKTLTTTAVLDFPNTATGTSSDLTVALVGAALGDVVTLGVPAAAVSTNGIYSAWVSAVDQITVRFTEIGAGFDPPSATFRVAILKY